MNNRIFVDIDGVLADGIADWCAEIERQTLIKVTPEQVTNYDLMECGDLVQHPELRGAVYDCLQVPGFTINQPVMEGSQLGMTMLNDLAKERGFDVAVVTARTGKQHVAETFDWMEKHFPYIQRSQLVFCRNKDWLQGAVLIDDYHENLRKFGQSNWNAHLLGIEHPYSQRNVAKQERWFPKNNLTWGCIVGYLSSVLYR